MKPQLLTSIVRLLESSGFVVSDCHGSRSCFDVLARKQDTVFLIKVLSNIEGLTSNTAHELKKVASLTGGVPLVLGERLKSSSLLDGVLYERYGVHVLNFSTLEHVIFDSMPVAHSIRGNYCATINPAKLRKLRASMQLTQEQLARELGVSKQSIYRYENSGRVALDVMERMLELFSGEGMLLLHEHVFKPSLGESQAFNMHVAGMKQIVASKLQKIGFSTSITNAPFDVVAREHETIYALVSNDHRRLEHKINLVNEIIEVVGGCSLCVTCRHVKSNQGVTVLKPSDLDEFKKPGDLVNRILGW